AHVPLDRLPTQPVELRDPERLDVPLGLRPDLLLDLELDRQALAVPPSLGRNEVPRHRFEAGVDVLERPGLGVVDRGLPVRGRRALVEDPQRSVASPLELPVEHVFLAPEPEHRTLELREVRLLIDRLEHRHLQNAERPVPVAGTRRGPRGTTPPCRARRPGPPSAASPAPRWYIG